MTVASGSCGSAQPPGTVRYSYPVGEVHTTVPPANFLGYLRRDRERVGFCEDAGRNSANSEQPYLSTSRPRPFISRTSFAGAVTKTTRPRPHVFTSHAVWVGHVRSPFHGLALDHRGVWIFNDDAVSRF